ncbi:MAG: acyl-CoA dehydrogenase family protein [Rhizomicrobium sp.]
MDMELNETQRAIEDSCTRLFARKAGPSRARLLRAEGGFDRPLLEEMQSAGFLDLFDDAETGPLAAALVTEWASTAAALAPIGQRALIAPAAMSDIPPLVVAVGEKGRKGPVRYAAEADLLILLDGDDAQAVRKGDFVAEPVDSKFGYPMARIASAKGTALAAGSGRTARNWWRVAIAAEVAGIGRAALDLTIRYLKDRVQFDRPIASYQAIQHRLVDCHVSTDAVQWAAREAAYHRAPDELAASAAIAAEETAYRLFYEMHQLTGAIGFTREYDLHLWTMRLQTLRQEAGGINSHAHDLVHARWG